MKTWIKKNYWKSFLLLLSGIFLWIRFFSYGEETVRKEVTTLYMENKFLGGYLVLYLLMLIPIFHEVFNECIIIRRQDKWKHIVYIAKKIAGHAVSYSFCLTIVLYLLDCSRCEDWLQRENLVWLCLLFLSQSIGWMVIGMFDFAIYMVVKREVLAFLLSEFFFIMLNLSLYVNRFGTLEYYLRMYYLMFHIEVFPTVSTFISVVSMYILFMVGFTMFVYHKMEKHQFV